MLNKQSKKLSYNTFFQCRQREPGDLVLSYYVVIKKFPILEAFCVQWRNSMPRFAPLSERGNESIKYLFFSSGNRTHNRRFLHTYAPTALTY